MVIIIMMMMMMMIIILFKYQYIYYCGGHCKYRNRCFKSNINLWAVYKRGSETWDDIVSNPVGSQGGN